MPGLGPIGDMASRVAQHLGYRAIAIDLVPERLQRAKARGAGTVDLAGHEADLGDLVRDMIGVGVDVVHAATDFAFGVADRRWRRAAFSVAAITTGVGIGVTNH